jgi:hypothetical protein
VLWLSAVLVLSLGQDQHLYPLKPLWVRQSQRQTGALKETATVDGGRFTYTHNFIALLEIGLLGHGWPDPSAADFRANLLAVG